MSTARETAKRSQDSINIPTQSVEGISAYKQEQKKITIPKNCCTGCGKKMHTDQAICPPRTPAAPAAGQDTTSSCASTRASPGGSRSKISRRNRRHKLKLATR